MSFDWLAWSNPVAIWWAFLLAVSTTNIALFLVLHSRFRARLQSGAARIELLLLMLCAAYVFGCAFRSVLPRADVQRICLFDTWLSSVAVGRSVATIAEVCFVIQCAIVLRQLAAIAKSDGVRRIANAIVPLILIAECFSWYSAITTSYLGNTIENSLWAVSFFLIAAALLRLLGAFHGVVKVAIGTAFASVIGYLLFLCFIDVPMYFVRWQSDLAADKELLGLLSGLNDVSTRWAVTHDIAHWKDEIAWMSLYFSVAVWGSMALCAVVLIKDHLPKYCRAAARPRFTIPVR